MKYFSAIILTILLAGPVAAQNEQAPIIEKPIAYKDWTYKNIRGGGETDLREFASGKKLVIVVYWAPWCPNWRHDLEFVQALHDKYASAGLGIIGVGLYDPTSSMKNHLEHFKLTFPAVYETEKREARLTSTHYMLRSEAGDSRKWGTPFYVFLDTATLKRSGDVLSEHTTLVSGELMRPEVEAYVQRKLGLSSEAVGLGVKSEVCEPSKVDVLKKP